MIESSNFDQEFKQVDFAEENIQGYEFEACSFKQCTFAHCDLSKVDFIDCQFENCNLMMAKPTDTGLKDVQFKGCKLVGFDFSLCNDFLFQVEFDSCQLDYAIFSKKKMKKTRFSKCSIVEADFTESDLTESVYHECQMDGSTFYYTILEKADLRTATNFNIDPEVNRIKKAKFSVFGLPGLLQKYDIRVEG